LQNRPELLAFHMAIFDYDHVPTDPAEQLAAIRDRIRRSLDDPRPSMTLAEVDAYLTAHFARAQAGNQTPSA
jgi:antitoxin ParD1/3/4